jgi:hypothetical protein
MPDKATSRWSWLHWLWISAVVIVIDLSTKYYFDSTFAYGETRYVAPFLNWGVRCQPRVPRLVFLPTPAAGSESSSYSHSSSPACYFGC